MIVIQNVTLYKCEYCGKKQHRAHTMRRHEKWCHRNPANRHACFGCVFLEVHTTEIYENGSGFPPKQGKAFYCNTLGDDLFTYKAEKMGLTGKYPEDFADKIRMPLVCKYRIEALGYNQPDEPNY